MLGRVGSSQGIHRATSPGTDLQSEPCATEGGGVMGRSNNNPTELITPWVFYCHYSRVQ